MSYEPRGKMIDLVAAMRAAPERAFTMQEVCGILTCKVFRSTVDQYIYAAVADGAVFKREIDGAMYYAGSAVSDSLLAKNGIAAPPRNGAGRMVPTGTRTPEEIKAAQADPRAPKVDPGWSPPKMVAPRAGSDTATPRPAPIAGTELHGERELAQRIAETNARLNEKLRTRAERPPPAPSPAPAPALDDASIPEGVAAEVDEEADEQPVEFNAALWLDGDLVIYGAVELEDGGMLISKGQLARLRRLISWSAP